MVWRKVCILPALEADIRRLWKSGCNGRAPRFADVVGEPTLEQLRVSLPRYSPSYQQFVFALLFRLQTRHYSMILASSYPIPSALNFFVQVTRQGPQEVNNFYDFIALMKTLKLKVVERR